MTNQNNKPAFSWALIQEPFEFSSPLPLEECVERLRSTSDAAQPFGSRNTLQVEISPTDAGGYRFVFRRLAGRGLVVEVAGGLERAGEKTYVHGHGRSSTWTLVLSLIILAGGFAGLYPTNGILTIGLIMIVAAILWAIIADARHRLVELVITTFGSLEGDPSTGMR